MRAEFGKRTAPDSPEFTVLPNAGLECNYSASFDVAVETAGSIEEVANNRVVVHFFEVSRGDKKKKTDTVTPLGSAEIDLLPLLHNTPDFSVAATITLATQGDETSARPLLDAKVTLSRPLLSAQQLEQGNLLAINVGGVFALPDSWAASAATPAPTFTLSLPVPSTLDADRTVTLAGGVAVPPKPATDGSADPDDHEGDFSSPDDNAFRRDAMQRRCGVRFPNGLLRVFLGQDALQRFLQRLPTTRVIPVEIKRVGPPGAAKGKGKKSDDDDTLFHGVSFVSATPLLYPGTNSVQGAYLVRPYVESEVLERMRLAGGGDDSKASKPRKARSALPDADEPPADSRLFLTISLALSRPLIARRPAAALAAQVAELIPPRPSVPRVGGSEARAVSEYESQIASVATMLIDEYRRAAADDDARAASSDQVRQRLVYELNSTGKYHALKEQLKHSIIKVVREKFLQTNALSDPAERHAFLSQLYVFLGQHMRTSLGSFFSFAQPEPAAPSLLQSPETIAGVSPSSRLLHAAHEAELLDDPARAATAYQDLVARYRTDVNAWCAYGSFACRAGDRDRAAQCFREALALQQTHLAALLAAGALAGLADQDHEAAVLLEAATTMHPTSTLAWTARALYYDSLDNDIGKAMCLLEARKICEAGHSFFLEVANHYTGLGLVDLAQRALAQEVAAPSPALALARIRTLLATRPRPVDEIVMSVEQALEADYHRAELWAILGATLQASNTARAIDALRHSLDLPEPAVPNPDTILLLARLFLQTSDFVNARELYLRYCQAASSAAGWEGLGVACYRLKQFADAREALAESNALDNLNAKVWAYLSLVSIHLGQPLDAQQSCKFALKLGLAAGPLLAELADAQEQFGFGNPFQPST